MRAIKLLCLAWLVVAASSAQAASAAVDEAQQMMQKGKYADALQKLDGYLSSAPQDAEARFTRGLVLVRLNRNDEAAKTFTELTRDYPQLPEPYNNLAVIYAQQGDYDKARDALEAALATHPSYPVAHENLGDIYAALAAAAYNRALALDPSNASAKAKLALVNQLDSLADSGATIAARAPAAVKASAPSAAPAAADASAPAAPVAVNDADIGQVVQAWAAAWSAKDTDKYLSFYAPEFAPEGGTSRETWESQRRARIAKPKEIHVTVGDIKTTPVAGDRVQVEFRQEYQSDALSNKSTKVLELSQVGGQWRIRREYTR
jgi:tetratricopeptide (TPR) repeat protein